MFRFVCVSLFCSVVNEYFLLVRSLLVLRLLYAVGVDNALWLGCV